MITVEYEKFPENTMIARKDFAEVTKTRQYDPPYWFVDDKTDREYAAIYGCLGWPGQVEDNNSQANGYAAIIGVSRQIGHFYILDEVEAVSPEMLVNKCIQMRSRWGFKEHPALMPFFFGDHLEFDLLVAQINVNLASKNADPFVISPPDDFERPNAFDIYFRRIQYVTDPDNKMLHVGDANIFRNRMIQFERGEPSVMAIGGLVHTALGRKPWMMSTEPNVFIVPDM